MQGTILIIDGVSTNRIMLKVQLSASWYHVVQADRLDGLPALVRRTRPDLVVTAMSLPDGDAIAVRAALRGDPATAAIPIVAITAQNDRAARLDALAAGIDDVLSQPTDDMMLQARIRNLIRARSSVADIGRDGNAPNAMGFADAAALFAVPVKNARVALVTRDAQRGILWRTRLKPHVPHHLQSFRLGEEQALLADPVPDVIVIELASVEESRGLRLLADLRARGTTRHAVVIAITDPANRHLAAEALDRGAHDVMACGFCPEELALRLQAQLRRKARADGLRASVRDELRAAVLDPLTGLFNRRHALPHLTRVAQQSAATGECFAVMLADLDHFKAINDRHGHPAGDAVLTEAARRMRAALRPDDMIARVGGEEFMIVMTGTDPASAVKTADHLCRKINGTPFRIPGIEGPVQVTISIGVAVNSPPASFAKTSEQITTGLINQADRALYEAKGAGRNQVSLVASAA